MNKDTDTPEFSRLVDVDKMQLTHKISATPAECAAVAERLGLLALEELSAELTLRPVQAGHVIEVKGELRAKVSQACVVTLDPVDSTLSAPLEAHFSEGDIPTLSNDFDMEAEGPDAPEPIVGGKIDLGELVVQNLSLALDPYPRKEGVEFKGFETS